MATTGSYKEYSRQERIATVEDAFNFGMSYVDTPLSEGYAKLLVNYDIHNQGTSLTPRGGLKINPAPLGGNTFPGTYYAFGDALPAAYSVHHTGVMLVEQQNGDATIHKYVVVTEMLDNTDKAEFMYHFNDVHIFVEVNGTYVKATWDALTAPLVWSRAKTKLTQLHGNMVYQSKECSQGMFISIDANTYIPVVDNNSNALFGRLRLYYADNVLHATVVPLAPKEITASQAINTGYNMLKPDPYSFVNTQNLTGALTLEGIIPKDINGAVKLSADVGETVFYHVHYTYPSNLPAMVVQMEVNDLSNNSNTQIVQSALSSPTYTQGSAIVIPYKVAYKQYTVVIKVFREIDKTAYIASPGTKSFEDTYSPLQVMTVSSYYTSADSSNKKANLTPKKYNIADCTGVCVWQQRAVVWGVPDALTTLFMSQPNLPEYFPYPNNIEVFTEEIITCVPYLTYLLVFTASKIYKLTMNTDGINTYYTTTCIQESIPMSKQDAATIRIVKNMVYFKSGNYFYMMVPNTRAGAGELQLAPVSRPIEPLLDNFHASVYSAIDYTYDLNTMFSMTEENRKKCTLLFVDYDNYLDGAVIRNVYKCKLVVSDESNVYATKYIDFVLNYDTVSRAWTTYIYESTMFNMLLHENTITSGTRFVTLLDASLNQPISDRHLGVHLLTFDSTSPKDEAILTTDGAQRVFKNYQLIDTGYRTHYPNDKKRFREIQFGINNISQDTLHFYTSFTVDDDKRKDLYTYEIQQITDKTSPDYGLIFVERMLDESIAVPGVLRFDTADGWALDFAKLDTITLAKVRYKVSGKGYSGKVQILSQNDLRYELLNTAWVYRKMNSR